MYQNWLKLLVLLLQQVVYVQKLHILLYNVDHVEILFRILKLNLVWKVMQCQENAIACMYFIVSQG
jgi:hypothetical protein